MFIYLKTVTFAMSKINIDFYNGDEKWLLRGTNWVFK